VKTQKTILIIEDEKYLREAVVDILHSKNFIMLQAKNGKDGLKIALTKHPDLILLDIIMPEMDGTTVLKKIREDAWGKTVQIIILTNLNKTNEQFLIDTEKNELTQCLIKSDWKLYDIVKKIEELLK
jgi:DNA-binding response OmpR family regulator